MKKYVGVALSLLTLAAPAGLALADGGPGPSRPPLPPMHLDGDIQADIHAALLKQDDEHASSSIHMEMETDEHATGTPFLRGEKRGILKHFGTTTPPGLQADHHHGTSTQEDAEHGNEGKGNGHDRGIISLFLQWFTGLPATTTVGDIRAQIDATTTASTTVRAHGGGFFTRLFSFLHFGEK